jgi:hypothetical protein
LVRGDLFFQVADVLSPTFVAAASAWLAAEAERVETFDLSGDGQ